MNAGYTDYSQDGYIDEYDLYLKQYDSNNNRKLASSEFVNPSTGQSRESNLFKLIDNLGGPLFAGDVIRAGYQDNALDNRDGYAKIKGTFTLATTAEAWNAAIAGAGQTISNWIQGPIIPTDVGAPPIKFGVASTDILNLAVELRRLRRGVPHANQGQRKRSASHDAAAPGNGRDGHRQENHRRPRQ